MSHAAVGSAISASDAPNQVSWDSRRNASVTPRQLALAYAGLCSLSLAVALGFVLGGVTMVLAFTSLELMAVGAAFVAWSRHVGDRETIVLDDDALRVTHHIAGSRTEVVIRAAWVRVEPASDRSSLIELSGQGRKAHVGRYLQPSLRAQLASEIRLALRMRAAAAMTFRNPEPNRP